MMINFKRALVMECSVAIEQMISNQICYFLDINREKSKLFGTGSGVLSFNQKVQFLLEVDYFTNEQKDKLNKFGEIRNKFAHLAEIVDFESCFESLTGMLPKLKKWYPEIALLTDLSQEDRYAKYFHAIFTDIAKNLDDFVKYYNNRLRDRYTLEVKTDNYDALLEAMSKLSKLYPQPEVEQFVKELLTETNKIYKQLDEKRTTSKLKHKL